MRVLYNKMITKSNEVAINNELLNAQSKEQVINGYYLTDFDLTKKAMCPSETLNKIHSIF